MKLALICLSLMMLWSMCVSEEVPKDTEADTQQVRDIVSYGVPDSQGYYRQPAPVHKPGISDLNSVGGVKGLLLLGLPDGKYRAPNNRHFNRQYLPQSQNREFANHNPYDQSQFDQRPFISQGPFPYSNGQRYQKVMGNPYSRIPSSWVGYPFPHRSLNNYNPSFIPGYVPGYVPSYKYGHNPGVRTVASRPVFYRPGVKNLKKYGGVEGLLRIGLPSTLLNH